MKTQQLMKFGTIRETEDGTIEFDGFNIDMNGTSEWTSIVILSKVIERLQMELLNQYQQKGAAIIKQQYAIAEPLAYVNKSQGAVSFVLGDYSDEWVPVIERPNAELTEPQQRKENYEN